MGTTPPRRPLIQPFPQYSLPSSRRFLKTVEEAHADAIARGADCTRCSLYGIRQGPVPSKIVENCELVVAGEAPGGQEVKQGENFTGASGHQLDQGLEAGGLSRDRVSVINAQACMPIGGNLTEYLAMLRRNHRKKLRLAEEQGIELSEEDLRPPLSPLEACRPRFERDVADANAKTMLAVGAKALEAFCKTLDIPYGTGKDTVGRIASATIGSQHGAPITLVDGRILCSTLHPAFAMHGEHQYGFLIRRFIERAAKIALRGRVDWSWPIPILNPTARQVDALLRRMIREDVPIAVDIETDSIDVLEAKIRVIGIGCHFPGEDEETVIVVPFRWRSGGEYWANPDDKELVAEACYDALNTLPCIFHNGMYDTAVLKRVGLWDVKGRWAVDTLLAHHVTDSCDLPHGLGDVTKENFEADLWKKDVDNKAAAGVATDKDEHIYNAKDVTATIRIATAVMSRVVACGTQEVFSLDMDLAPIYRDMGTLGLPINEWRRGQLSAGYNKLSRLLTQRFQRRAWKAEQEIAKEKGRPVRKSVETMNPRSWQQVGTWLYEDLGYEPPLNPDGEKWKEGDDWSTSTPALMQLVDEVGVDPWTRHTLETLLELRGCETVRGRQIDRLRVRENPEWSAWAGRAPAVKVARAVVDTVDRDEYSDTLDVEREEDLGDDVIHPERPGLSWMPLQWKIHVTPSGRAVCVPTVQNWSIRAWEIDGVATNTREMIVAAPGHVFVGADYEQLEARLYAWASGDEVYLDSFENDRDIHILNYAGMKCKNDEEIEVMYAAMVHDKKYGTKEQQAVVKYLRTYAKNLCIAEGELVLTDRGEVPIEQVTHLDKVWDGVEWVSHDGVIFKGLETVIEHDGLWATPDHKVWLAAGTTALHGDAARRGDVLARTARGRVPLRFVEDDVNGVARRALPFCDRRVSRLRAVLARISRQSYRRKERRLSSVRQEEGYAYVAAGTMQSDAATLHEPEARRVPQLRRSRDSVSFRFDRSGSRLDRSEPRVAPRVDTRSKRQQRTLRTRQFAIRNAAYATHEPSGHAAVGVLGLPSRRMAVRKSQDRAVLASRIHPRTDPREGTGDRPDQAKELSGDCSKTRTARVYDILNAGPRRRFTVSGCLVSNCFLEQYGGEEEKLYETLANARDKSNNKKVFKNLTKGEVEEAHQNFHKRHPWCKPWQRDAMQRARRNGFSMEDITFRHRYWPGGPNKKNAPPNMEIQGRAGGMKNRAVLKLHDMIPFGKWSKWTGIVIDIHDFLMVQVPENRAEEAALCVERAMYYELPYCHRKGIMRFPVEVKISYDLAQQG